MVSVVKAITSLRDKAEIMVEVVILAGEAISADASHIVLLEDWPSRALHR
jgi:hypothetical protein